MTAFVMAVLMAVLMAVFGPGSLDLVAVADGGAPVLRVRVQHDQLDLPKSGKGQPPAITPAFANVGRAAAPGTIVMSIVVNDVNKGVTLPASFSNCFYGRERTSAYCEFPGGLEPGSAYETNAPFRAHNKNCCQVHGTYDYDVWPIGSPPDGPPEDYRHTFDRGRGPELGLQPVDARTIKGNHGVMNFETRDFKIPTDWAIKGVTLRGAVRTYAEAAIDTPTVSYGSGGPEEVRVELPEGTSIAIPGPDDPYPSEIQFRVPRPVSCRPRHSAPRPSPSQRS
ncbi:hypothetical protein AB0C96_31975 [Streptomyces sp. NPDC048506]|uniref:hypothetical protein n=1 Tax=Streptomyces sp. NPDC048506 TaxID=3155028 RepID=UPI00343DFAF8